MTVESYQRHTLITDLLKDCISQEHSKLEKLVVNQFIHQPTKLKLVFKKSLSLISGFLDEDGLILMKEIFHQIPSKIEMKKLLLSGSEPEKVFSWLYIILGSRNGLRILGEPDNFLAKTVSKTEWIQIKQDMNFLFQEYAWKLNLVTQYTQQNFIRLQTLLIQEFAQDETNSLH